MTIHVFELKIKMTVEDTRLRQGKKGLGIEGKSPAELISECVKQTLEQIKYIEDR